MAEQATGTVESTDAAGSAGARLRRMHGAQPGQARCPGSGSRSSSSGSSSAASRSSPPRTGRSSGSATGVAIVGCLIAPVRQDDATKTGIESSRAGRLTPRCALRSSATAAGCRTLPLGSWAWQRRPGTVRYEHESTSPGDLTAERGRGPAAHPLRAGVSRRRGEARRRGRGAAAGRGGPARHDLRARAVARAGRVRAARAGRAGRRSRRRIGRASKPKTFEYWAHAACILPHRGLAVLRLAAAGDHRARPALAQGLRARPASEVLGATARRGAADRDPARRRQGGRPVVGLVGGEDRRRVAARHRPGGLRAAHRLAARLRPARARHSRGRCSTTQPTDAECLSYLVGATARALGVATHADLIEYQRLNGHGLQHAGAPRLDEAAAAAGLTPVTVPGAKKPAARLGRPGGAGLAGRRRPRHAPHDPAVPVRLADLGQEADAADVRLPPPVRAVRAQGEARARLLHDAAAGRRPDRRLGGPGPRRQDARRQERAAWKSPPPSRPWPELWPRRLSGSAARMFVSNGPRRLPTPSRSRRRCRPTLGSS